MHNLGRMPISFNSQPPEGGWLSGMLVANSVLTVSTHSRPKAAGPQCTGEDDYSYVSTHSRPKAAGLELGSDFDHKAVSTHSRPKAAGSPRIFYQRPQKSFNSQPPEGGWPHPPLIPAPTHRFQLTAARRRLGPLIDYTQPVPAVSTHSRPKAAGSGHASLG